MLGATIYIVPALVFICLGSADIQPWNSCTEDEVASAPFDTNITAVDRANRVEEEPLRSGIV